MKRLLAILTLLALVASSAPVGAQDSNVRLEVQQSGTSVKRWGGGTAVLNCGSGVTCTLNPVTGRVDVTASGGVSGSGTTDTVPKWTGSGTLGDSRITDVAGGNLNILAPLKTVNIGDDIGAGNGTAFRVNDSGKFISANVNGGRFFLTGAISRFEVNDASGLITFQTTAGNNQAIDMDAGAGAVALGDLFGAGNSTKIDLDDPSQTITINAATVQVNGAFSATTVSGNGAGLTGITWSQIDKTTSSIADITTRSASDLNSGTLPAARMPALTGDVTTSAGAVATTLATVNSNVGSFGSSSAIPVVTVNAKGLVTAVSTASISVPTGANPTASVGTSAVNGSSANFMRSDGAPALSQSITPTWTGSHIWSLANSAAVVIGPNGATNPLAQFDTSVTSAATGIRFTGNAAGNGVTVTALSSGSDEKINITAKGNGNIVFSNGNNTPAITGYNFTDGVGDYFSLHKDNGLQLRDTFLIKWFNSTVAGGSADLFLRRRTTANLNLGNTDAASPVAQKISTQGSRGGTDSNVSGASLTVVSGLGTGNSTPSSLILQSPLIGSTGTTAQTATTGLTILNGAAVLTGYTVAGLPSASTCGAGAMAFVTDATQSSSVGIGTTVAGGGSNKVVVVSDGTNWIIH